METARSLFPVSLVLDVDGSKVLFGCLVTLSVCALFAHYNGPDVHAHVLFVGCTH